MYLETAEFDEALTSARREAIAGNKLILVEMGGDWCIWCKRLQNVLQSTKVSAILRKSFIHIGCLVESNGFVHSPVELNLPIFSSVPFLILLDSEGNVLASARTEQFELWWFYNKIKLTRFLQDWAKQYG